MGVITFSRSEGIEKAQHLFSNRDLLKLFAPLVIEQFLEYLVGLVDSIMVSHVGEAAVSGVSLVDFVMALLISLFTALSTGGAVIAGQYIGKKKMKDAENAANQLVWFEVLVSIVIMVAIYFSRSLILSGLFGRISPEVYNHANIYLTIVSASIPFLALYNAGAALFRTMGNSKVSMRVMIAMNLLHVAGNAILIYMFGLGTVGVGISTLVSRIGAGVIIIILAMNGKNMLRVRKTLLRGFDWVMIRRILGIGVPYGLENGMFYLGRIVILSLVATFGTAAIAANSVSGTIVMFQVLPGMAIGLGLTVIISRCVGFGDFAQVKYYTRKILGVIYIVHIISSVVVLALLPLILNVYGLSSVATAMIHRLVWYHVLVMIFIWPLGYTLPVTFRASGDAKFPMTISIISMLFCRIALAYAFSLTLHMGMIGTWVAMFIDWIFKAMIFVWRYFSGKWTRFRAIA